MTPILISKAVPALQLPSKAVPALRSISKAVPALLSISKAVPALLSISKAVPALRRDGSCASVVIRLFFVVSVLCFLAPVQLLAENSNNSIVVGSHVPISDSDIPPVGHPMRLRVVLKNTTNIQTRVRLVGSKDNRFVDLAFPSGRINQHSRVEYSLEVPAPLVGMVYQIVVHQPDGTVTTSKQFSIRRNCIEDFHIEIPATSNTQKFKTEVATLVSTAKRLEHESYALEQALEIVTAMESGAR